MATKKKSNAKKSALVERATAFKDDVGVRLLSKPEVMSVTGTSFPTLWQMMRAGTFPRSRIVGGRSMWLSTDIDAWLVGLKVRPLKGDAEVVS
jgi:prophage regulatory protein